MFANGASLQTGILAAFWLGLGMLCFNVGNGELLAQTRFSAEPFQSEVGNPAFPERSLVSETQTLSGARTNVVSTESTLARPATSTLTSDRSQQSPPSTSAVALTRPERASRKISLPGDEPSGNGKAKSVSLVSTWTIVVLLLIGSAVLAFVLRFLRKHGVVGGATRSNDGLQVRGRRQLDTRQSIQLVRVGRRVLVLGASIDGLRTLAEVTDPVEVDYLSGLCRPLGDSPPESNLDFLGLLTRMTSGNADRKVSPPADTPAGSGAERYSADRLLDESDHETHFVGATHAQIGSAEDRLQPQPSSWNAFAGRGGEEPNG